jgi:hypothetical protein
MALFSTTRTQQSNNLVEFRAGKMFMRGTMVHPDKRKGLIYVHQSDDSLMHFCWKDRTSGTVEDDLIVFPDDIEFVSVKECTTGRVFLLKFKTSSRKLFFWMQEPKADKDEEHCRKVNELLNNPPTLGSARTMGTRGTAAAGSESMPDYSMMNQLLNMGGGGGGSGEERMDLQNVLAGMDQQQLMQLLNLVGGGSGGGLDSPLLGGSGSTPAVTSSARSASSVTPAVVSSAAAPSATATVTTASTGSSQATSVTTGDAQAANQKPIQVADLRNILSNMTIPTAATRSADDVVDLDDVLTANNVERVIVGRPEHQTRLLPHLPNEAPINPDGEELQLTLRSPQFRQALGVFSMALQSGQLGPSMRQFGFSNNACESLNRGDIQSVAEILEMEGSGGGGQSVEGNKRAKEDDGASPKEPSAKKDKPDDDPMDLD